jgi:hypothetical protein
MNVRVTPEVREMLHRGYERFYLQCTGERSLKDAYLMTLLYFFSTVERRNDRPIRILLPPNERPSYRQFLYHRKTFAVYQVATSDFAIALKKLSSVSKHARRFRKNQRRSSGEEHFVDTLSGLEIGA